MRLKVNALFLLPIAKCIKNTAEGIGKNEE